MGGRGSSCQQIHQIYAHTYTPDHSKLKILSFTVSNTVSKLDCIDLPGLLRS